MFTLQVFSIFRDSESYVDRYINQLKGLFDHYGNNCRVVWLEGDSIDNTYLKLFQAKLQLEEKGNEVVLIKFNIGGVKYESVDNANRWNQISSCWNTCLSNHTESKYTMVVESDLIYDYRIVPQLVQKLNGTVQVLFPMLMCERSVNGQPRELFYDTHGFKIEGKHFVNDHPFFPSGVEPKENLVKIETGGGLILSTYKIQVKGSFNFDTCVMEYPSHVNLFLDTNYKIQHP